MKKKMCAQEINTEEELLIRVNNATDIICQLPILLKRTWTSLYCRLEINGGHIEQIL